MIASRMLNLAQKTFIETAPRVSAVKLIHTVQFYNREFPSAIYFIGNIFVEASSLKVIPHHPAWRDLPVVRYASTLTQVY